MKRFLVGYTTEDYLLLFLRIVLGALFLFSGFVKLIPIEPFEFKFVELGVANWATAPVLARLIIAGEILLGIMLLFNIYPRKTAIATLLLLIFFTLYLGVDIYRNGNSGNCGCFGTFIVMTPLESIVKNLLMIPLVLVLLYRNKRAFGFRPTLITTILIIVSIATPFILYPPDSLDNYLNANTEQVDYPFPVDKIPDFQIEGRKIDLTKDEHIIAFFSIHCLHCKNAAYKLYILSQQHKLPPVYMVLLGKEEEVAAFKKETKGDFPYYLFNDNNFLRITGNSFPKIFYLKNGIVKGKFDTSTLTEETLLKIIQAE